MIGTELAPHVGAHRWLMRQQPNLRRFNVPVQVAGARANRTIAVADFIQFARDFEFDPPANDTTPRRSLLAWKFLTAGLLLNNQLSPERYSRSALALGQSSAPLYIDCVREPNAYRRKLKPHFCSTFVNLRLFKHCEGRDRPKPNPSNPQLSDAPRPQRQSPGPHTLYE